ncbi:MAG: metallophosphoesterase [Clostridia bacterium]|nr:metallophosphoesterase [Clostridia bacterium]
MKDLRYLTDSYDEKIRQIQEINAPLNFVFITDQHNRMNELTANRIDPVNPPPFELAADAIDSIQYILDRCPNICCVVCGGDIGDDYDPDPVKIRSSHKEVMDALYRLSVPVHCCIGNHDDALGNAIDRGRNTRDHVITPSEMHELCMKYNPTPENYYYIDIDTDECGYRMVFLNTSDKPYFLDETGQYPFGWRNEISNKQAIWLEREALQTDRRILVFGHAPLHNAHIFGTEGGPAYIKPYDDLLNGPRVYYAVKQCKNVIAAFAGHVHYDNIYYDDDLLSVTTLCSLVQEWAPGCPKRTIGTSTETAFDVFSIKKSVLYATRFGAGEDRMAALMRVK